MSQARRIAVGQTATEGAAPDDGGPGFIIVVLALVMVLDLLSFGSFWIGQAITAGEWTRFSDNLRTSVWPEFLKEAEYYARQNMMLTNSVLEKYLEFDRGSVGNGGPFIDYFTLKALRVAGFLSYFAGGFIVVLFIGAEAYRRNREKRMNFERMSSTAYHFTLNSGAMFSVCGFFLCVFMPSLLVIPGIMQAQVPFLLYSPYMWAAFMTLAAGGMVYGTVSNFTHNA